jgi:hypothetical protein
MAHSSADAARLVRGVDRSAGLAPPQNATAMLNPPPAGYRIVTFCDATAGVGGLAALPSSCGAGEPVWDGVSASAAHRKAVFCCFQLLDSSIHSLSMVPVRRAHSCADVTARRPGASGVAVCGKGDMLLACVSPPVSWSHAVPGVTAALVSSMITSPGRGVPERLPDPLRVMLGSLAVAIATAYPLQSITQWL